MLLILQGVHECKGITDDYLRLESLIQKVVSPYLGTYGLYSKDGSSSPNCSSCLLEKRRQCSWSGKPSNSSTAKNPVVRSKSYNVPMLSPVVEYDTNSPTGGGTGIRRHSVSEMTSCVEESSSVAESASGNTGTSCLIKHSLASIELAVVSDTVTSSQGPQSRVTRSTTAPLLLPSKHHSSGSLLEPSPCRNSQSTGSLMSDSPSSPRLLAPGTSSGPSPSSSPEMVMDHIVESLDSETEPDGIFLDFSRRCSGGSTHSRDSGRQSVA